MHPTHGGMQAGSCAMCNVEEEDGESPGFALLLVLNAGESRQ